MPLHHSRRRHQTRILVAAASAVAWQSTVKRIACGVICLLVALLLTTFSIQGVFPHITGTTCPPSSLLFSDGDISSAVATVFSPNFGIVTFVAGQFADQIVCVDAVIDNGVTSLGLLNLLAGTRTAIERCAVSSPLVLSIGAAHHRYSPAAPPLGGYRLPVPDSSVVAFSIVGGRARDYLHLVGADTPSEAVELAPLHFSLVGTAFDGEKSAIGISGFLPPFSNITIANNVFLGISKPVDTFFNLGPYADFQSQCAICLFQHLDPVHDILLQNGTLLAVEGNNVTFVSYSNGPTSIPAAAVAFSASSMTVGPSATISVTGNAVLNSRVTGSLFVAAFFIHFKKAYLSADLPPEYTDPPLTAGVLGFQLRPTARVRLAENVVYNSLGDVAVAAVRINVGFGAAFAAESGGERYHTNISEHALLTVNSNAVLFSAEAASVRGDHEWRVKAKSSNAFDDIPASNGGAHRPSVACVNISFEGGGFSLGGGAKITMNNNALETARSLPAYDGWDRQSYPDGGAPETNDVDHDPLDSLAPLTLTLAMLRCVTLNVTSDIGVGIASDSTIDASGNTIEVASRFESMKVENDVITDTNGSSFTRARLLPEFTSAVGVKVYFEEEMKTAGGYGALQQPSSSGNGNHAQRVPPAAATVCIAIVSTMDSISFDTNVIKMVRNRMQCVARKDRDTFEPFPPPMPSEFLRVREPYWMAAHHILVADLCPLTIMGNAVAAQLFIGAASVVNIREGGHLTIESNAVAYLSLARYGTAAAQMLISARRIAVHDASTVISVSKNKLWHVRSATLALQAADVAIRLGSSPSSAMVGPPSVLFTNSASLTMSENSIEGFRSELSWPATDYLRSVGSEAPTPTTNAALFAEAISNGTILAARVGIFDCCLLSNAVLSLKITEKAQVKMHNNGVGGGGGEYFLAESLYAAAQSEATRPNGFVDDVSASLTSFDKAMERFGSFSKVSNALLYSALLSVTEIAAMFVAIGGGSSVKLEGNYAMNVLRDSAPADTGRSAATLSAAMAAKVQLRAVTIMQIGDAVMGSDILLQNNKVSGCVFDEVTAASLDIAFHATEGGVFEHVSGRIVVRSNSVVGDPDFLNAASAPTTDPAIINTPNGPMLAEASAPRGIATLVPRLSAVTAAAVTIAASSVRFERASLDVGAPHLVVDKNTVDDVHFANAVTAASLTLHIGTSLLMNNNAGISASDNAVSRVPLAIGSVAGASVSIHAPAVVNPSQPLAIIQLTNECLIDIAGNAVTGVTSSSDVDACRVTYSHAQLLLAGSSDVAIEVNSVTDAMAKMGITAARLTAARMGSLVVKDSSRLSLSQNTVSDIIPRRAYALTPEERIADVRLVPYISAGAPARAVPIPTRPLSIVAASLIIPAAQGSELQLSKQSRIHIKSNKVLRVRAPPISLMANATLASLLGSRSSVHSETDDGMFTIEAARVHIDARAGFTITGGSEINVGGNSISDVVIAREAGFTSVDYVLTHANNSLAAAGMQKQRDTPTFEFAIAAVSFILASCPSVPSVTPQQCLAEVDTSDISVCGNRILNTAVVTRMVLTKEEEAHMGLIEVELERLRAAQPPSTEGGAAGEEKIPMYRHGLHPSYRSGEGSSPTLSELSAYAMVAANVVIECRAGSKDELRFTEVQLRLQDNEVTNGFEQHQMGRDGDVVVGVPRPGEAPIEPDSQNGDLLLFDARGWPHPVFGSSGHASAADNFIVFSDQQAVTWGASSVTIIAAMGITIGGGSIIELSNNYVNGPRIGPIDGSSSVSICVASLTIVVDAALGDEGRDAGSARLVGASRIDISMNYLTDRRELMTDGPVAGATNLNRHSHNAPLIAVTALTAVPAGSDGSGSAAARHVSFFVTRLFIAVSAPAVGSSPVGGGGIEVDDLSVISAANNDFNGGERCTIGLIVLDNSNETSRSRGAAYSRSPSLSIGSASVEFVAEHVTIRSSAELSVSSNALQNFRVRLGYARLAPSDEVVFGAPSAQRSFFPPHYYHETVSDGPAQNELGSTLTEAVEVWGASVALAGRSNGTIVDENARLTIERNRVQPATIHTATDAYLIMGQQRRYVWRGPYGQNTLPDPRTWFLDPQHLDLPLQGLTPSSGHLAVGAAKLVVPAGAALRHLTVDRSSSVSLVSNTVVEFHIAAVVTDGASVYGADAVVGNSNFNARPRSEASLPLFPFEVDTLDGDGEATPALSLFLAALSVGIGDKATGLGLQIDGGSSVTVLYNELESVRADLCRIAELPPLDAGEGPLRVPSALVGVTSISVVHIEPYSGGVSNAGGGMIIVAPSSVKSSSEISVSDNGANRVHLTSFFRPAVRTCADGSIEAFSSGSASGVNTPSQKDLSPIFAAVAIASPIALRVTGARLKISMNRVEVTVDTHTPFVLAGISNASANSNGGPQVAADTLRCANTDGAEDKDQGSAAAGSLHSAFAAVGILIRAEIDVSPPINDVIVMDEIGLYPLSFTSNEFTVAHRHIIAPISERPVNGNGLQLAFAAAVPSPPAAIAIASVKGERTDVVPSPTTLISKLHLEVTQCSANMRLTVEASLSVDGEAATEPGAGKLSPHPYRYRVHRALARDAVIVIGALSVSGTLVPAATIMGNTADVTASVTAHTLSRRAGGGKSQKKDEQHIFLFTSALFPSIALLDVGAFRVAPGSLIDAGHNSLTVTSTATADHATLCPPSGGGGTGALDSCVHPFDVDAFVGKVIATDNAYPRPSEEEDDGSGSGRLRRGSVLPPTVVLRARSFSLAGAISLNETLVVAVTAMIGTLRAVHSDGSDDGRMLTTTWEYETRPGGPRTDPLTGGAAMYALAARPFFFVHVPAVDAMGRRAVAEGDRTIVPFMPPHANTATDRNVSHAAKIAADIASHANASPDASLTACGTVHNGFALGPLSPVGEGLFPPMFSFALNFAPDRPPPNHPIISTCGLVDNVFVVPTPTPTASASVTPPSPSPTLSLAPTASASTASSASLQLSESKPGTAEHNGSVTQNTPQTPTLSHIGVKTLSPQLSATLTVEKKKENEESTAAPEVPCEANVCGTFDVLGRTALARLTSAAAGGSGLVGEETLRAAACGGEECPNLCNSAMEAAGFPLGPSHAPRDALLPLQEEQANGDSIVNRPPLYFARGEYADPSAFPLSVATNALNGTIYFRAARQIGSALVANRSLVVVSVEEVAEDTSAGGSGGPRRSAVIRGVHAYYPPNCTQHGSTVSPPSGSGNGIGRRYWAGGGCASAAGGGGLLRIPSPLVAVDVSIPIVRKSGPVGTVPVHTVRLTLNVGCRDESFVSIAVCTPSGGPSLTDECATTNHQRGAAASGVIPESTFSRLVSFEAPVVLIPTPPTFTPTPETKAAAGAAGAVVAVGGIVGPMSGMQQGIALALLRMTQCDSDDESENDEELEDLELLVHPLRFPIGVGPLRYVRGALIGNLVVVPALWAIGAYFIVPLIVRAVTERSEAFRRGGGGGGGGDGTPSYAMSHIDDVRFQSGETVFIGSGSARRRIMQSFTSFFSFSVLAPSASLRHARDLMGWPSNLVVPISILSEGTAMASLRLMANKGGVGPKGVRFRNAYDVFAGAIGALLLLVLVCAWVGLLRQMSLIVKRRARSSSTHPHNADAARDAETDDAEGGLDAALLTSDSKHKAGMQSANDKENSEGTGPNKALVCYRVTDLSGWVAKVVEARWEWGLYSLEGRGPATGAIGHFVGTTNTADADDCCREKAAVGIPISLGPAAEGVGCDNDEDAYYVTDRGAGGGIAADGISFHTSMYQRSGGHEADAIEMPIITATPATPPPPACTEEGGQEKGGAALVGYPSDHDTTLPPQNAGVGGEEEGAATGSHQQHLQSSALLQEYQQHNGPLFSRRAILFDLDSRTNSSLSTEGARSSKNNSGLLQAFAASPSSAIVSCPADESGSGIGGGVREGKQQQQRRRGASYTRSFTYVSGGSDLHSSNLSLHSADGGLGKKAEDEEEEDDPTEMTEADREFFQRRMILISDSWWLWSSVLSFAFSLLVGVAEGMPTPTPALCRLRWVLAMVGSLGQALSVLTNPIALELALLGVTGLVTLCIVVVITLAVFGFDKFGVGGAGGGGAATGASGEAAGGSGAEADVHVEGGGGASEEQLSLTDALNGLGMLNAAIGIVLMAVNVLCAVAAILRDRARSVRAAERREEKRGGEAEMEEKEWQSSSGGSRSRGASFAINGSRLLPPLAPRRFSLSNDDDSATNPKRLFGAAGGGGENLRVSFALTNASFGRAGFLESILSYSSASAPSLPNRSPALPPSRSPALRPSHISLTHSSGMLLPTPTVAYNPRVAEQTDEAVAQDDGADSDISLPSIPAADAAPPTTAHKKKSNNNKYKSKASQDSHEASNKLRKDPSTLLYPTFGPAATAGQLTNNSIFGPADRESDFYNFSKFKSGGGETADEN